MVEQKNNLIGILEKNRIPIILAKGKSAQLVAGTTGYSPMDIGAKVFLDGQFMGSLDETPCGKIGFYRANRKDIIEKTLDKKFPRDYEILFE